MYKGKLYSILSILVVLSLSLYLFPSTLMYKDRFHDKASNLENSIYSQQLVKHVYIVLVDGLRYDSVIQNMPYISKMIYNKNACLIKARFTGPSNSRPGYARIFTGTSTSINGIWLNEQQRYCKIPGIFEIAKDYGLCTGVAAYFWIGQLFCRHITRNKLSYNPDENIQYSYFYTLKDDSAAFEMGSKIIEKYKPDLFLIHTLSVDTAGHKHGAMSSAYINAVSDNDILIESLVKKIDLKKSVVIVLSDHGHKNNGGHGGNSPSETEVPIIFIGDIVNGGIYNEAVSHEDVAPTICVLLGLPFSRYMSGSVIDFPFNINKKYLMGKPNKLYKIK